MTLRGAVKGGAALLLLLCAGAAVYYGREIREARRYTVEELIPKLAAEDYPLTLDDFGQGRIDTLLAVEDPRFFEHHGVDLSTPGAGITTVTQGLVKRLYFDKFRPGIAKIRQTLIARFVLDPLVSKEEQLRLFVNIVPLGHGVRGFDDAARHYYRKPFGELGDKEYLSLVAAVIAPKVFDPAAHPDRNGERVRRIELLLAGTYRPKGLFDLTYGPIEGGAQREMPPLSYFPRWYGYE